MEWRRRDRRPPTPFCPQGNPLTESMPFTDGDGVCSINDLDAREPCASITRMTCKLTARSIATLQVGAATGAGIGPAGTKETVPEPPTDAQIALAGWRGLAPAVALRSR